MSIAGTCDQDAMRFFHTARRMFVNDPGPHAQNIVLGSYVNFIRSQGHDEATVMTMAEEFVELLDWHIKKAMAN
jgi:hypothetical protein